MYIALDQIEKGDKPTVDDLALVSDAVELTNRFYFSDEIRHDLNELMEEIIGARRALLDAYLRHEKGLSIRLSGPGMQAVRSVMDRYYSLLAVVPERTVLKLHRETELANIRSLKAGNAVILKGAAS